MRNYNKKSTIEKLHGVQTLPIDTAAQVLAVMNNFHLTDGESNEVLQRDLNYIAERYLASDGGLIPPLAALLKQYNEAITSGSKRWAAELFAQRYAIILR